MSEEAAQVGDITGEGGPDLSQGTPVQEVGEIYIYISIGSPFAIFLILVVVRWPMLM